jgi:hypothetical protein
MLSLRSPSIALAVLACAIGGAALAQTSPEPAKAPPAGAGAAAKTIEFYLAHGDTDACGRGCSEWIAAEGKIDAGAASRLRQLLAKLGRRRPPIYFHSPSGSMAGSLELGRLIHEQKLAVSIAHTVPLGCDRDKPGETSCEAQKRAGQAIEAEIDLNTSMCNSGCVYVLAGGVVRFVPPWVKPGIHDVGLDPTMKKPPRGAAAAAKDVAHEHIQDYLHEMGFDKALLTAASAVPFETVKFLERDEVVRFGLDRREFGEAAWRFTDKPNVAIAKMFFVRAEGEPVRYLNGLVSLVCVGGPQKISLVLLRAHGASEPPGTWPHPVGISMGGQRIELPYQSPSHEFDTRVGTLPAGLPDKIGEIATIGVSGFDPGRDDATAGGVTLNMDGFPAAYARLRKICGEPAGGVVAAAPSTMSAGSPYSFGNSPFGQGPPAVPGATVSPHAPATPTSPQPEAIRSAANGSTTPAEPPGPGCRMRMDDAVQHRKGRVTGFLSEEEALTETKTLEAQLEAKMSPAYVSLKRATVETYPRGGRWETGIGIPGHMAVEVGDVVELDSRHRDPSLPCSFVPWTINRIIDHAQ